MATTVSVGAIQHADGGTRWRCTMEVGPDSGMRVVAEKESDVDGCPGQNAARNRPDEEDGPVRKEAQRQRAPSDSGPHGVSRPTKVRTRGKI